MESVAESTRVESQQAKAWLLSRSLESPIRESTDLVRMATIAKSILDATPTNRVALGRLGQVFVLQAYSLDEELDHASRETKLRDAIACFAKIDSLSVVRSPKSLVISDSIAVY